MASDAFFNKLQPSWKISNSCVSRNEEAILRCFVSERLVSACIRKQENVNDFVFSYNKGRRHLVVIAQTPILSLAIRGADIAVSCGYDT